MIEERRRNVRFPVMRNVGEPIELKVVKNNQKISIPGFILNLSSGGVKIVTLGHEHVDFALGTHFDLDLKIPHLFSHHVEGRIIHIQKGDKAKLHHTNDEWFLSLEFTKIKGSDQQRLNRMAEDWSICETKIQLGLPDICFRECAYWDICEKNVKMKEARKHGH
jgi:c-di-GMP-binding flagellar brake protein YcgR